MQEDVRTVVLRTECGRVDSLVLDPHPSDVEVPIQHFHIDVGRFLERREQVLVEVDPMTRVRLVSSLSLSQSEQNLPRLDSDAESLLERHA